MRIHYNDEERFPGQFDLWRANTERQILGKTGQRTLRELEAALLALPEPKLVRNAAAKDGRVCTIGALLVLKRTATGMSYETATAELQANYDPDDEYLDEIAVREGVAPELVAWRLVELNDVLLDRCTDEERYERVLAWVRGKLKAAGG